MLPELRERAQQGRVLMINAGEDEVVPRACTEKLASALGIQDRVVWLDGLGHYTALAALPKALKTAVDFFAQDLPADAQRPRDRCRRAIAAAETRAVAPAVLVAGGALSRQPGIVTWRTWKSRCTLKDGKQIKGRIRLVRGPKPKFSLQVKVSGLAELSLGVNDVPWMASDKVLFLGSQPPHPAAVDPLAQANPQYLKRLGVVEGLIATVALAPEILDQWVTVEASPAVEKAQTIRVALRGEGRDRLQVVMRDTHARAAGIRHPGSARRRDLSRLAD